MKRFSILPKKAAKISATPSRAGKITLIDGKARKPPSLGKLVLLANLMSEGKYDLFLLAFSPRLRAEIVRGARDIETRVPVLPKWEPTERHLAELQKKDGTQQ